MRKRYAYIGLGLMTLMFMSTFAYAALQSNYLPTQNQVPVTLPTTRIVTYALAADQENLLLQQGQTLVKFRYPIICQECQQQKIILETFVTSGPFSQQLYLEEIGISGSNSTTTIFSNYGQQTVENMTSDNITNVLCQIVTQPPAFCALDKVK